MKVLIIGGVAGGASTATRLRRMDEKSEIILFERGAYISYANCGLPYYIGGTITNRDDLFVHTVHSFKNRFNIDVRVKSEVLSIDKEKKEVSVRNLESGDVYVESYDKLVISTGSEPIKPPLEGIQSDRIFTLRNVPDTDRIVKFLSEHSSKKAIVIGAGFIGLEMVENLRHLGLKVSVVEKSNQVMAPIDFSMASIVHQHLKDNDVDLYLSEGVVSFELHQDQIIASLESGKKLIADLVILSIGVRPDVKLVKDAGLQLGHMGGIWVNEYMQTSDADIYALGDATEVWSPILHKNVLIPLAGPANKQARVVADNIVEGNKYTYKGTIGTSIAKVFDLTVAATGISAKILKRENIAYISSFTHGSSHASYYPGASDLSIKIIFSPDSGRLLGAQVVGKEGVDKRIDVFAEVIRRGGSIYDLMEFEHAYAPPYSSAKDPVNIAGYVAENILKRKVDIVHWRDIPALDLNTTAIIDVRTKAEWVRGNIKGAINIPLDELRGRLSDVPKNKKIIVYCAVGLRGYLASQILKQYGFMDVYSLSGGFNTYLLASKGI